MDAKNDCELIEEISRSVRFCYQKMDDEISVIKNEWEMMSDYFEGEQAEKFKEKTQKACDSVVQVMDSLQQMQYFLQNLDERIREYNRTKYLG